LKGDVGVRNIRSLTEQFEDVRSVETPLHEAAGIQPLVAHSPLMSWVFAIFSERAFSALLGVAELAISAMIYLRSVSAKVSAIGSDLVAVMFLTTLTFLFSTPGLGTEFGRLPSTVSDARPVSPQRHRVTSRRALLLGEALPEALRGTTRREHGDHE
jgi:hypothetical protein